MDNSEAAAAAAGLGAMLMVWMVVYLAVLVFMVVAWWNVFTKAGKPGWAVLIPIYNVIVMLEIIGKPWWWLLLLFIPFVNFVILIIMVFGLAKAFGQGVGFGFGILFLGIIFIPILAFGSARYVGPDGVAATTPA